MGCFGAGGSMAPVFTGFLRSAPSASPVPPTAVCDLVIPAFNRPDLLRDLLASLERHTNRSLLGMIWIGDDASDSFSRAEFVRLAKRCTLPVTLLRHEKNLGFAGNCNTLLRRVARPYCIVLNTDVTVPPFWLERMLAPLRQDPSTGLATPFGTHAANHTLRLQPGQSWIEADRLLASRTPAFPDDCTAIGFCLGMDVELLRKHDLFSFDPSYGRGYGEDTDLHYRVLAKGLRSVIVDNLLIHHTEGASFSTVPDGKKIRAEGMERFLKRWGDTHALAYTAFEKRDALAATIDPQTRALRFRSPPQHFDVLFVLPSTHLRYGGVWFVCRMLQSLTLAGLRVAAYVKDRPNIIADTSPFGFTVFQDSEDLRTSVASLGCVVSTSDVTIRTALSLSQQYRCTEALFLQCMEVAFRSGISIDTFLQYRRIPNVVTVSEALCDYIRIIHPDVHVAALPIGPDPFVFYPRDCERIPRTVAIAVNAIPEKAYTHALEFALMLRERGFHLTFFGWDHGKHPIPPEIGEVMTDTSRDALAHLFSRTEFIVDESYLEGLGLLPLEAAFCGCIPITSSKGAPEYFFRDGRDCIRISGYLGLKDVLDEIAALSPGQVARLRSGALKLRTKLGLPQGLDVANTVFRALAKAPERHGYATQEQYAVTPAH